MTNYFTNYDDYVQIMYMICNDQNLSSEEIKSFTLEGLKFHTTLPSGVKKKVEYFNSKLGKYKIIKSMRGLYSWQKNDWCVYVTNRGFTFEVKKNLTTEQAFLAWEDFLLIMGYQK